MILVVDPITKLHEHHLGHFVKWYADTSTRHELDLHLRVNTALQKVQKQAVEKARKIGASHILWTEHDHWGYPRFGLDELLHHDKDVIGMQTYQRSYPFQPMQMRKVDPSISFLTDQKNLKHFSNEPGNIIEQTDLITWAFTLVKMEVFNRIDDAAAIGTFSEDEPWIWDKVPTDSHFCECCEILGIDRWICAAAMVNHGDIPPEDILIWRRAFDSVRARRGLFPSDALDRPMAHADEDHTDEMVEYHAEAEEAILAQKAADEEGQGAVFDFQAEKDRMDQSNAAKV